MPVPTADNEQLQQDLESFAPGALAACELYGDEYKADDKEFTEEYQEVLRDLVRKIGANQGMWARRIEVQNKRRNRLYWQGIQRIAWDWKSNQWMIPYSGPVTPGQSGSGDAAERPPILDTTNIYQAYGRTCTAPILSNNPTVRFEAVDPKEPIDIRAASTAEKMRKVIERNN